MIKQRQIYKVYREFTGELLKEVWFSRETIDPEKREFFSYSDHKYRPTRSSQMRLAGVIVDLRMKRMIDTNRIDIIHRGDNGRDKT